MKRHYSDFAQHALRYYFKVESGDVPAPTDQECAEALNYDAAEKTVRELDLNQRLTLRDLCLCDKIFADTVTVVGESYKLTGRQVWGLMAYAERRFSIHRGLIDS